MTATDAKIILLVEDNPDDEALTLRAFRKNNVRNPVVVVRDGADDHGPARARPGEYDLTATVSGSTVRTVLRV